MFVNNPASCNLDTEPIKYVDPWESYPSQTESYTVEVHDFSDVHIIEPQTNSEQEPLKNRDQKCAKGPPPPSPTPQPPAPEEVHCQQDYQSDSTKSTRDLTSPKSHKSESRPRNEVEETRDPHYSTKEPAGDSGSIPEQPAAAEVGNRYRDSTDNKQNTITRRGNAWDLRIGNSFVRPSFLLCSVLFLCVAVVHVGGLAFLCLILFHPLSNNTSALHNKLIHSKISPQFYSQIN